jgi:hypothetical protein
MPSSARPPAAGDFHDHEDFLVLERIKVFVIMEMSKFCSDGAVLVVPV